MHNICKDTPPGVSFLHFPSPQISTQMVRIRRGRRSVIVCLPPASMNILDSLRGAPPRRPGGRVCVFALVCGEYGFYPIPHRNAVPALRRCVAGWVPGRAPVFAGANAFAPSLAGSLGSFLWAYESTAPGRERQYVFTLGWIKTRCLLCGPSRATAPTMITVHRKERRSLQALPYCINRSQ